MRASPSHSHDQPPDPRHQHHPLNTIPDQEGLQQFLMRTVTETPRDPVDVKDPKDPSKAHSDAELAAAGKRLAFAAGMASMGSQRKESIEMATQDLMSKVSDT